MRYGPVELNLPVAGSYVSTEARYGAVNHPAAPPAMRTRPSASCVALWPERGVAIEPVAVNVPVFGSYSSAEARLSPDPPNRTA